jgi:hypothetical protein
MQHGICYCVHMSPEPDPFLDQIHLIHTLTHCVFKIRFRCYLSYLRLDILGRVFPKLFPTKCFISAIEHDSFYEE